MAVVGVSGSGDELADGTGGSVDAVTGTASSISEIPVEGLLPKDQQGPSPPALSHGERALHGRNSP